MKRKSHISALLGLTVLPLIAMGAVPKECPPELAAELPAVPQSKEQGQVKNVSF